MQYLNSVFLGILEGLTEFIPVSSTGHLILGAAFLKIQNNANVFEVFIQIGAILAVIWARRMRLLNMARGILSNRSQQFLAAKILLAFIPAAVAGFFLYGFIKTTLFSPVVVAISLIIGGIVMIIAEDKAPPEKYTNMESMPLKTALGVGICQIVSLIPGISRAGASIVGARLLGVERRTAAEFSFFLAIPTICGAAAYDLYKNRQVLSTADIPDFAIGTIAAFISALIVINWMIDFVGRRGFKPFGYYRIGLGVVVLALVYTGLLKI